LFASLVLHIFTHRPAASLPLPATWRLSAETPHTTAENATVQGILW